MISEIRGIGMLTAIEFRAPKRLRLRIPFEAFARIHPAMFGQVVVMHLFRKNILAQICGNNFMVLKISPPLIVTEEQLEQFVDCLSDIVKTMHSGGRFWSDALGMARRVIGSI
jgi:ornithine--oxo-acid transaminase